MDATDPVPRPPDRPPAPTAPAGGWPTWLDPDRDLVLTPRRLRGLVHPIRVRLLNLLSTDGPATASQLGRRLGHSSGVTSYHLRILAELGYVAEDTTRGNGRDRWWRPVFRKTAFSFRSPGEPADPETVELAEQYLRMGIDAHHQRMISYVDTLAGRIDELPRLPWMFSEEPIEVTDEEANVLKAGVMALVARYRRDPGRQVVREGATRAVFAFQMLPDEAPPGDPPAGAEDSPDATTR